MEANESLLNNELHIDATAQSYLSETAKWGNFLSIVGFILSGLIAIIALFAGTIFSRLTSIYTNGNAVFAGTGIIMIVYLLIAALYFFMSLLLYRFSKKMKIALYSSDQLSLNDSFLNLKKLYKLFGILTIIYLGFIALIFIIAIATAAFR
jgi:hypothetical protein